MSLEQLKENLERRGYRAVVMPNAAAAAAYLDAAIDGTTVGIGGSSTVKECGVAERLATHNRVFWHSRPTPPMGREEAMAAAATAEVYLCSVNGISLDGKIVNIDGVGNRVASTIYGHRRVYFLVGSNKVAEDEAAAVWRARNIAAPRNAARLGRKTPCATTGRCHDCSSPDRICCALSIFLAPPMEAEYVVILIDEPLGY